MEFVGDLWLAILIGTIVLWMASFVAWVILPHHFGDFQKLPNEDAIMDELRAKDIQPGNYMFPQCASKKDMNSKEHVEKYTAGPRGTLNVYAFPNMGVNMALTILYFFVTIFTIAYITHAACPPSAETTDFMRVFQIAGTIGVLTYGSSGVLNRIWFKSRQWTEILDGVVYGIILGLIFAMCWPGK